MQRIGSWARQNHISLKRRITSLIGLDISVRRFHIPVQTKYAPVLSSLDRHAQRLAIELEYGIFDTTTRELHVIHDAGLYSCLSVTLWSLADLLSEGYIPLKINFSQTLISYKDAPEQDLYSSLYSSDLDESRVREIIRTHRSSLHRFDHHGAYAKLPFDMLKLLLDLYLRPNQVITDRTLATKKRFIVPNQRYLGVCFRGTDKATEVMPIDSSVYLELAERLLNEGQVDRILIQTDQEQVSNLFRRNFGGVCDMIESLPRTRGTVAIHLGEAIAGSRLDFALDMMAAVNLLAEMEQVIVYTGNIGAWVALLRGSSRGVWQALPSGIHPQWKDKP